MFIGRNVAESEHTRNKCKKKLAYQSMNTELTSSANQAKATFGDGTEHGRKKKKKETRRAVQLPSGNQHVPEASLSA